MAEGFYSKPEVVVEKFRENIINAVGRGDFELVNDTDKKYPYNAEEKFGPGHWSLKLSGGTVIASFTLQQMVGCCGVCISTGASVHPDYQKRGLGLVMNSIRIDMARAMGYGVLMCTDVVKNEPQRKILVQNGWKDVHEFINPRTKNRVAISVINL